MTSILPPVHRISFLLIAFFWVGVGLAAPYRFSEKSCNSVRDLVVQSLQAKKQRKPGDELYIEAIEKAFAAVDRSKIPTEDALELIFLVSVWRHQMQRHLFKSFEIDDENSVASTFVQLTKLQRSISPTLARFLHQGVKDLPALHVLFRNLVATRGTVETQKGWLKERNRVGPLYFPNDAFKPEIRTRYGNTGWLDSATEEELVQLSNYEFVRPDEIRYRGVSIRSGDVVMLKQNHGPEDLHGSFSVPRSCFSHSAQIVFLKRKQHTVPAVLEIHETGLRFVPLNLYFDGELADYAELYRLKDGNLAWETKATEVMDQAAYQPFGRDYLAQDIDPNGEFTGRKQCVNCSSMIDWVFKKSGRNLDFAQTEIPKGMVDTLEKIDEPFVRFLSPTDLMRSPKLRFVGVIDNGNNSVQIAKEVVLGGVGVAGSLGHLLSTHEIDLSQVPMKSAASERLVKRINEDRTGSDWALKLLGYTRENFPRVPAKAFAAITAFDESNHAAVQKVAGSVAIREAVEGDIPFSLHEFETSPSVESARSKEMALQRRLLKEKGAPDATTVSARRVIIGVDTVFTYILPTLAAPVFVLEDLRRHTLQTGSWAEGVSKTWEQDSAFLGIYLGGTLGLEIARRRWLLPAVAVSLRTGKEMTPPGNFPPPGSQDKSQGGPTGPNPPTGETFPHGATSARGTLASLGTITSYALGIRQARTILGLSALATRACMDTLWRARPTHGH